MRNVERYYNVIYASLFLTTSKLSYDRIQDALMALCEELDSTETDESVWNIGQFTECALGDLIFGAYWHFSEWYEGIGKSYQTLCSLGTIFSPGVVSSAETDNAAYQALEQIVRDENRVG